MLRGTRSGVLRDRCTVSSTTLSFAYKSSLSAQKGLKTGRSEDKKLPPLNNNEDKKMSLLWGGRERESGTSISLSFSVKLLTAKLRHVRECFLMIER